MCLAVPVQVKEVVNDQCVKVEIGGVFLKVSSLLTPDVSYGDYVLVHAGFIIEKLTDQDAQEKLDLFKEIYAKLKQE